MANIAQQGAPGGWGNVQASPRRSSPSSTSTPSSGGTYTDPSGKPITQEQAAKSGMVDTPEATHAAYAKVFGTGGGSSGSSSGSSVSTPKPIGIEAMRAAELQAAQQKKEQAEIAPQLKTMLQSPTAQFAPRAGQRAYDIVQSQGIPITPEQVQAKEIYTRPPEQRVDAQRLQEQSIIPRQDLRQLPQEATQKPQDAAYLIHGIPLRKDIIQPGVELSRYSLFGFGVGEKVKLESGKTYIQAEIAGMLREVKSEIPTRKVSETDISRLSIGAQGVMMAVPFMPKQFGAARLKGGQRLVLESELKTIQEPTVREITPEMLGFQVEKQIVREVTPESLGFQVQTQTAQRMTQIQENLAYDTRFSEIESISEELRASDIAMAKQLAKQSIRQDVTLSAAIPVSTIQKNIQHTEQKELQKLTLKQEYQSIQRANVKDISIQSSIQNMKQELTQIPISIQKQNSIQLQRQKLDPIQEQIPQMRTVQRTAPRYDLSVKPIKLPNLDDKIKKLQGKRKIRPIKYKKSKRIAPIKSPYYRIGGKL